MPRTLTKTHLVLFGGRRRPLPPSLPLPSPLCLPTCPASLLHSLNTFLLIHRRQRKRKPLTSINIDITLTIYIATNYYNTYLYLWQFVKLHQLLKLQEHDHVYTILMREYWRYWGAVFLFYASPIYKKILINDLYYDCLLSFKCMRPSLW